MQRVEIDFYKEFRLPTPLCGIVSKVTSPRGKKISITDTTYSYHLYTEMVNLYKGDAATIEPGLYWVLDVCKPVEAIEWYQYLFVVEKNGDVYPVAEYLRQVDSTWVRKAMPLIKDYFAKKKLEPIKLTRIRMLATKKTRWTQVAR